MSVTWTNELTETLIDLYRNQSVLWDSSDVDYKNKNKKRDAWKTISDIMGLHELEIQRKIKNLTTQFYREKKKLKEENKSGSTMASDIPRWFAYQRLLFLTDKFDPKLRVEKGLNETQYDSGPETGADISQNQSPLPNEVNTNDIIFQPHPDPQPECLTMIDIRKNIKASKRKISNDDKGHDESCDILKEPQEKTFRNRFTIFGEHVATKIEALKSSYAQNVVEHLISNILFEASIGKYDHLSSPQYPSLHTHSTPLKVLEIIHEPHTPQYASSPSPN